MLKCYTKPTTKTATPLLLLNTSEFSDWQKKQKASVKNYLKSIDFDAAAGKLAYLCNEKGDLQTILVGISDSDNMYAIANLPFKLPEADYKIENELDAETFSDLAIGWGLGAYQFSRYKKATREPARLLLNQEKQHIESTVSSIYLTRDLINTPAEDMGPEQLSDTAKALAKEFTAKFKVIVGDDLLKMGFPAVHRVGRASDRAPRLIEFTWGNTKHKKVTLVGKGICFDSGGLDLKPASNMLLMKKDMGGAANVLGLARMIMQAQLPICLRVLIPAADNAVAGNAYRPGDVITMRNGKTVEITNTDAEGRLVLSDALVYACESKTDLLIDMATLTGAARVALGTDIAVLFSNNEALAQSILNAAGEVQDPIWQLPLYQDYHRGLKSEVADMVNSDKGGFAGAITAALFLQRYVSDTVPWAHFDIMGFNNSSRTGHPEGGEAMAIRALFKMLS